MDDVPPLSSAGFSELLLPLKPHLGASIAVAVSGGADSLCLTVLLGEWCREQGISLTALTVDHGLREEAAAEAENVGLWLKKYNIPHHILQWEGDKPQSNIQDQARLARYFLMGEWCQNNGVSHLFLAHHKEDQAETFLLRLFRGSGVDGLSAMQIESNYPVSLRGKKQIKICRPLLTTSKACLVAGLKAMEQPWIEDPSNQNNSYMRVKVRNLLRDSEIEGLNANRMAKTASRMNRVKSLLQSLADNLTDTAMCFHQAGYGVVDLSPLMVAHEEIALRSLARWIKKIGGGKYAPRLVRLEALYDRLRDEDFSGQTLGGCLITSQGEGQIMISREVAAIKEVTLIKNNSEVLWDGRFIIESKTHEGVLKKIEQKDWRQLCDNLHGLRKLKMPKVVRDSLPCITSNDGKIYLPNFIVGFEKDGFEVRFNE